MIEVGITERGDPSLDFSWVPKLKPQANIIISKNLTSALIEALVANKERCIFHCTCTGWGSSKIEPNVPKFMEIHEKIKLLIEAGFPVRQIVLRIDPIIPVKSCFTMLNMVLNEFSNTGISRVRYSYLDMYPHVLNRFREKDIELLTTSNFPSEYFMSACTEIFSSYKYIYTFESCAESDMNRVGCISDKDLDILGIKDSLTGHKKQRTKCLCPANKTELLSIPKRCAFQCTYCYWHD